MRNRPAALHPPDQQERGATAVEYALVLSVVSVLLLVALFALGPEVAEAVEAALAGVPW